MPKTSSLGFPNMFDTARNQISVLSDNSAVVSRVRLLLLTDPTELFNEPSQGGGLRRYLFQYNTENVRAMIRDRIKEQLRAHEPCVDADKTQFGEGLAITDAELETIIENEFQNLKMTVGLSTIYGDQVNVEINSNPQFEGSSSLPDGIYDGVTDH